MASITKFEDLTAWQEARALVNTVYSISTTGTFARDFGLRDQIQRAAVSVMANIAEGFDCESTAEFARFLGYARRSAVEVQALLYAAFDVHYLSSDEFGAFYEQARKCKALIGGLRQGILNNPRHARRPGR